VEAHLVDTKTFPIPMDNGATLPAGGALHDMHLRMTINTARDIIACEAAMESTPYPICPTAAPNFARLAGLRIEGGFLKEAISLVGGTSGCTHLRELLQQVATVAIQTLYSVKSRRRSANREESGATRLPPLLNTCAAYDETGPVIKKNFPAFYKAPENHTA